VIHQALAELKDSDQNLAEAFDHVTAVGISTLGVVHRGTPHRPLTSEPRLDSIFRKSWRRPAPDCRYVIDFRSLFDMFGRGKDHLRIVAENDATACCFAEYQLTPGHARPKVLYYVVLSDGVNAGILVNGFAPNLPLHPEVGHIRPVLYERDTGFVEQTMTGCKVHGNCFEGLASHTRIMKQWGKPLHLLAGDSRPGSPLDIIATYAAELAWAGACATAPEKFVIGGHVVVNEMIPLVRSKFDKLNSGYLPHYPVGATGADSFIQRARLRQHESLLGALEMARRAAVRHQLKPV
jgi:predicted NBD/HSP70 family sugar kinase